MDEQPISFPTLPPQSQSDVEDQMIQAAFDELLRHYMASCHRKRFEVITRAFHFARQAHRGVRLRSGMPYIMHPIAVARIVSEEIGLGSTSICSALLHDVVENTDYTVEDVENIFGPKIAQIVDGLTKISGGVFGDHASAQAENFKRLLLTMSDDIRVILVKIADRLDNMRTLDALMPVKQMRIAGETLYIYAPLAHRLGLYKIKTELENLAFRYEFPDQCREIEARLAAQSAERDRIFHDFTTPIRERLDRMGLKYTIKARVKTAYSIWRKMQTKHVTFDEVYDLLAVRIIFTPQRPEDEQSDCFAIYLALTKIYKPHPDRLRDWITHPKANGYQALHVTLMSGDGQWIEVQIRSEHMHAVAEQGLAAHWKYKDGDTGEDQAELDRWLLTIKEILDDPQPDAMDFLDTIKLNLFASEIFVFTPKGEFKTMPQGSTALDFAFSLHTDIGSHCIGAKVNHRLVPLSHRLQSGDQVEILTSKSQRVQPEWVGYATTARARSKITSILRREAKAKQHEGEALLTAFLEHEGVRADDKAIYRLTRLHHFHTPDELLEAIGSHRIELGELDRAAFRSRSGGWRSLLSLSFGGTKEKGEGKEDKNREKGKSKGNEKPTARAAEKEKPSSTGPAQEALASTDNFLVQKTERQGIGPTSSPISDTGEQQGNGVGKPVTANRIIKLTEEGLGHKYTLADCCHPIPGDAILGYVDDQGRTTIHKRRCPVAARLKTSYGDRIVATQWDTHGGLTLPATIYLKGIDDVGLLGEVSKVISGQLGVGIRKLSLEATNGLFEGRIELLVHDTAQVQLICRNLQLVPHIKHVVRVEE